MMKKTILAAFAAAFVSVASAAEKPQPFNILADLIQADPATESLVASGHVTAVHTPFKMISEGVSRDRDEVYRFENPTMFTTCTNAPGHLHWHVSGAFEYKDGEYAVLRDGFVHFWEIPILWVPYLATPLWSEEGLRVMPGYTGRWGAYLMTKYIYHLAGARAGEDPEAWGLDANTRFDMRWEQGLALGQSFNWRLGDYGAGHFKVYYAWDRSGDNDIYANNDGWHLENWGSEIPTDRYALELAHVWEATERDRLRLSGAILSDSYFREDFFRNKRMMLKNQFLGYNSNELAWEHLENWAGLGMSVCGPLNDFFGGTARLPEFYFDVNPLPVFGLPVNYESENRFGYLRRKAAHFGRSGSEITAFNNVPGPWAEYETFRLDTYHRLTAPMKFADAVSVVPRLAYRGTFWGHAGNECLTGWETTENTCRNIYRSILEGGVTFAGRGTADLGEGWRHTVEPYLDVLAQKAWYSGLADGARPYVFDAIDASLDWSDQFASRGRNLPYSWYGLTPGVRNVLDVADEKGNVRQVLDIDAYVALQCNDTTWLGTDRSHRLAEVGRPNYGKNGVTPVPGVKFRWSPLSNVVLSGRFEYDSDENTIALGGFRLDHRIDGGFKWYASLLHSDYRRWDFASSPYDPSRMTGDEMNLVHYTFLSLGFEQELCDAVAWSPYLRWDCIDGQLDAAGSWIDFRTDCLGFRFLLEYENSYVRIDGSEREEDFSVGFYIYLRAFGADSGNVFND